MKYARAVINFDERCSLSCPFCYVPFIGEKIDFSLLRDVLYKCKSLDVRIVTFAGGDPFDYSAFREILRFTYKLGFEIHIDTNGVSINSSDYKLLSHTTSLVSLPLDGSDEISHDKFRHTKGHFDIVVKHIRQLQSLPFRLKINTIVSKGNILEIPNILKILNDFHIDIWSVYQFMALDAASMVEKHYAISDIDFENLLKRLVSIPHNFHIEKGKANDRRKSYLFLSPKGRVYTHNPKNNKEYIKLGSIFDGRWEELFWKFNKSSIREESEHRYISLNST